MLMFMLFVIVMFFVFMGMFFDFFELAGLFLCLSLGLFNLFLCNLLFSELNLLVFLAFLVGGGR